ncbi:MAG: MFS transporter [Solirubrobacteraceae bacterium]
MEENKWWTLSAVCVAIFMLLLDITIVNVALPDIQKSLGASFGDLQWVVSAYALSLAALLLAAGSLADLLGRRKVFVAGLILFTLASLGCGLAGSPKVLILARAVQGIGGAVMFACSLSLIAGAFQGKERGTAFGIFGATTGAAVAIGPLVGGAITEAWGWEWIFFINIPIGILAVTIAMRRVAESKDPRAGGIDWPGVVLFSLGLFALVYALERGNEDGWGSGLIVSLLIGAFVLLVAFVLVERARGSRAMLDLSLFRKPAFAGAAIVAFALSSSMFAMFLYLTLYIQGVLGYAPLEAGLRFLPITLLSFFVAPIAGRLSVKIPVRLLLGGGLLLVGVGLLLMRGLEVTSSWTALLAGFLIAGAGIGMVNPPLVSTAVGVVHPSRSGMASGIGNTFRQAGIATGIAGLGAIFQHQISTKTTAALASAPPAVRGRSHQIIEAFSAGQGRTAAANLPAGMRDTILTSYKTIFSGALDELLLVAGIVALIGAVAGLTLVRGRDFVATGPGAASAEPALAPAAAG